ncbi:CDGSH iron-sulfur domain-containing protein [Motiliproteus sediminis]|uniref:CDGSH iron-sulfur domain-containing protein n=1 Tax=Motiliproteus sediminis TaxID=1468178 RepID=UPI001AF01BA6|nr:CDGSH iron-sulfur domain-containing protein [Motiliproteus sediminis]
MSDVKVAGRRPAAVTLDVGEYYYCACGRSAQQPFCDGSHKGTGLGPQRFDVEQREQLLLCTCKQTADPPYCDGSHRDLDD